MVIAHPWRVIALWIACAVVVIVFSPSLSSYTTGNNQKFLPSSFESVKAQNVGNQYFPASSGATGIVVVTRADGAQLTSADQSKAAGLATSLQSDKIAGVSSAQSSPKSLSVDQKAYAVQVAFQGQPGDGTVNAAVVTVRDKTNAYLKGSGLSGGLTGNAAIQVDTTAAYNNADKIISIATVIAIVVLLGLIFRSPIVSILPIIVIGIVFKVVTGLTADLAKGFNFEVSSILQSLLVVVLFGIGTDYIVFLLFRYRQRLRDGLDHGEALVFTGQAVGKVIASSALTVMGAFAALLLAKLGSLNTLAPGLIVAVAVMLATALTLIPALFVLLGSRLFWPMGIGHAGRRDPFAAQGRLVARRPLVVAAAVGIPLIILAIVSTGYKATYNSLSELPSSTPSQQAYNLLAASFPPGALSPTQVYVVGNTPLTPTSLSTLNANLTKASGVSSVAPSQISQDTRAAYVSVVLKDDPYSNAALDDVKGPIRDAAHGSVPGDSVYVGGQTSTTVDVRDQLHADTRLVFPVAAAIIAVILGLLLQALLAPLVLLVCVGLTFAATLGAEVLVFLHGTGYAGIDFTIPIVLYLFVVAVGTDYNILISSRLREEFLKGNSFRDAARIAVINDSPTVAAAGIILALTFASLMLTGLANLVELGFGVAVGIIIAAFGVAPMMVPSLSTLGHRPFWWPTRASAPPPHNASEPQRVSGGRDTSTQGRH